MNGGVHVREYAGQAALGTAAQLTQGVIGLALLLVGHETHLGVTASALAVSAFAIGMAVGRPVQGRALDRNAAAPVLIGCALAHGGAYVVLAVAAHRHWSVLYAAAALVAGLTLPPIATQMRAAWPHGRHPRRSRGCSRPSLPSRRSVCCSRPCCSPSWLRSPRRQRRC